MGIWAEIKHALNSTLGTSSFTSLDKLLGTKIETVDTNVKGLRGGGQTFTSSGTFTVPYGVTKIWVTACAGGQAGYYLAGASNIASGGAGGDWIVRRAYSVTSGSKLSITVGKGGTTSGAFGGSTVVGSLVTLACPGTRGGNGGIANENSDYFLSTGKDGFSSAGICNDYRRGSGGGSLGCGGSSGGNGLCGGGGGGITGSSHTACAGGDGIVIIEW